ncbi:hypothetical protein PCASD_20035 [Puccinia coronata f. sp. avenae]|uniref:Uncharacterized protein n=1 Tax=Puccinia coronata f. sp. avenae TaxID=200324 RepID=A0A2N5S064_9BASI|nr:hypothetical protein PCASD_20035 [Puccinia coronata f. sp. avenae]
MLLDGLALWLPAFSPDHGQVATLSLNGQELRPLRTSDALRRAITLCGSNSQLWGSVPSHQLGEF